MTKRLPAAPLVDADHDSRAAADHRSVGSCEDPCLVSRNEMAKRVLETIVIQYRPTHIRDQFL